MELFGLDLKGLLATAGLVLVFIIIFAESSLIFFLPGDSFLFVAGILAAQGVFHIIGLIVVAIIAAILGNNAGYYLGKRFGRRLFSNSQSKIFHPDHLVKTENFYRRFGPITIILARYTPVVRTFAPLIAGIGKMNYRTFVFFNAVGAILWVVSVSLLGYFLGSKIPNIDHYIIPIILIVVLFSVLPAIVPAFRHIQNKRPR